MTTTDTSERIDPRRAFLAVAAGALLLTIIASALVHGSSIFAVDANTYFAAASRLNEGHDLYSLSPGDRPVHDEHGVPLLSPPFIAVVWRPLAFFGSWTMSAWTVGSALCIIAVVLFGWIDHPRVMTAAMILLALPLLIHLTVGNVNGFLMAATAIAMKRPRLAPALIGVMTAVKIWPLLLAFALVRGSRQLTELAVVLVGCGVVSVVGAGWQAHLDYLNVVRGVTADRWSFVGVAGPVVTGIAVAVALTLAVRGSARAAVVASVIANPALHVGAWSSLLPVVAEPTPREPTGRLAIDVS